VAHLLPANDKDEPWSVWPPESVHDLPQDFPELIGALEDEFARKRSPRVAGDGRDRAILIHVSKENRTRVEESLGELRELTTGAGLEVIHESAQRRPIDPKYVMGKGRLKSVVITAMQLGAEVLVFDLNLTPAQVKNLAEFTDLKILDRTQVILDIFAQRAQTREGKIQVELAQLRYMLPFLSMKHTAMSRLTGGIGGRGPGETKLEINRRRAQDRITQLQREVDQLGKRRRLRRSRRTEREVPTVSIVGYTNAGKSTLLNCLTRSEVVAEDALFATLNPVSRRLRFPKEREVVITDTVGFIRKLPPELKDAFRTTFEEIDTADLLLHVLDASSPEIDEHYATVNELLRELEYDQKPTVVVLNKIDRCDEETVRGLIRRYDGVPVCALDRETFGPLLEKIDEMLWGRPEPAAPEPNALVESKQQNAV
jgi:GTP-binding protein HflX